MTKQQHTEASVADWQCRATEDFDVDYPGAGYKMFISYAEFLEHISIIHDIREQKSVDI